MGSKIEKGVLRILDRLYRVAQDDTFHNWAEVYSDMADLVGGGPGSLVIFSQSNSKNGTPPYAVIGENMEAETIRQYREYYQHVNPLRDKIAALRAGESLSRRAECPDRDYEKLELYNDLFRKIGLYEFEYHGLYNDAKINGGISFSRPKERPEFSKLERQALDILIPHVRRAFYLQQQFIDTSQKGLCLTGILDRLDHGVLIVDGTAKVVHMNAAADRLMVSADGLEVRDGVIKALRASENQELRGLLKIVFSEDIAVGGQAALDMLISRPSGARPLHLSVFRFSGEDKEFVSGKALAAIFVHDLEQPENTSEELLISTYGMTVAEARISSLLTDGLSVNEASEILNVQPNTVRAHLKNIYSKTDTNRQSELIRLILKGPGKLTPVLTKK